MVNRKNILITVSGGKTSGFMAVYCKERYKDDNLLFCFANTGKELPQTYEFLKNIEAHFDIPIVWLEADVNPEKGKGTGYTVTGYDSAKKNGEPFESVIKKYGLPSKLYRHCTRELKEAPVHSFAKEYFSGDYLTAIGIRADEQSRLSKKPGIIYPLAEINISKQFINDWWSKQPFNLELSESQGNCDFCFLKSKRKRINLLKGGLDVSWWSDMEQRYGDERRPMMDVRNGVTVQDLVRLSEVQNLQMDLSFDFETNCFCGN